MVSIDEFISMRIQTELKKNTLLYLRFNKSENECVCKIKDKYYWILKYIDDNYPIGHVFREKSFIMDAMLFSLAYSAYVTEEFMRCPNIIVDFIERKLVSNKDGYFDSKLFNEGISEFEIFIYLFISIYFKSDLFEKFISLNYETQANNNKRFEYTFCFNDREINIEVKALTCDPFIKDNISIFDLKHGDLFYKSYFPTNSNNDVIPEAIKVKAVELQSNYRQFNSNIKKIKKKCIEHSNKDLNFGFIIINYGTSIEEFISYLLNPKNGIITKNSLGTIDVLILFSMCTNTTFFLDEIYDNGHILSFIDNECEDIIELVEKLRIDNLLWFNGRVNSIVPKNVLTDEWQLYKGIKWNEMVTIQPETTTDDTVSEHLGTYKKSLDLINYIVDQVQK